MSQGSGAIISGLHATVAGRETSATGVQMDFDANGNMTYFGVASPGTQTTDSNWQISKYSYDANGNLLNVLWANGKSTFENIWTAHAGLTYS